ncbi:MAG: hypothetical protein JJD98_00075 [Polaromonas sp.]|nr:hypothetical protein [Polaromonas sp.]
MTLIKDWRTVLAKAWSLRLILLSGLLSGLEVAMPSISSFFEPLDIIPPGTMAMLAVLVSAGAGISRLIAQPKSLP